MSNVAAVSLLEFNNLKSLLRSGSERTAHLLAGNLLEFVINKKTPKKATLLKRLVDFILVSAGR